MVDVEVSIEREDTPQAKVLGRSNQRRIRQIHRPILILLHHYGHPVDLLSRQVMQEKPTA